MEATLQDIFRNGFEPYAASHKLPLKHHKAANAIMRCRTPEQGGHEYHSCRHRSFPKYSAQSKAEWVDDQSKSCTTCGKFLVNNGVVIKNSLYKVKPHGSVQPGDQRGLASVDGFGRKWFP